MRNEQADTAARIYRRVEIASRCSKLDKSVPFDEVIAVGFFDYVREAGPVMAQVRSLTGGRLIASFPSCRALRAPFRKIWFGLHGCGVYFYSKERILALCDEGALLPESLLRMGPIYLLVARPAPSSGPGPDIQHLPRVEEEKPLGYIPED